MAPAALFATVHPDGSRLAATLTDASSGAVLPGPRARVSVDMTRRQITLTIPHQAWDPQRQVVRMAMGIGLWNSATHAYLLPQALASATTPGGAGTAAHPAAFFNVAFRTAEPQPSPTAGVAAITNAAWWRDEDQGTALAAGNLSGLYANVDFGKLAGGATDNSGVPQTGPMDRILASHYEIAQGADFSNECGFGGATKPSSCTPEYTGQLAPYAIYVPAAAPPATGYGMTLLLHSLSANYNQYSSSNNQSQFANRAQPSIVITPEARGPDQFYEGYAAAEVFEAWADVAARYPLNPAYSDITGYSMGGIGTFKLGAQFPDLFARAQPTVGDESNNDVVASLRNLPVLMWNNSADELVNPALFGATSAKLLSLGYRYETDIYQPCFTSPMPAKCSPLFPNHLELAVNDQFAPAAAFLGSAQVDPNPSHVTYVVDTARDRPSLGVVADHAYWVSGADHPRSRTHERHRRPGGPDRRRLGGLRPWRPVAERAPGRHRDPGRRQPRSAALREHEPQLGCRPGDADARRRQHQRHQHRHRDDRPDARPRRLQRDPQHHHRRPDRRHAGRLRAHRPRRLRPPPTGWAMARRSRYRPHRCSPVPAVR